MIIFLLLFSISLIPENIGFNFAFELRGLVFAIGVAGLFGSLILKMLVPTNRDARNKRQIKNLYIFGNRWNNKFKLKSLDIVYIAVTFLTVISFVTKTPNINAFHYVFVQFGMVIVYFFIRSTKKNTIQRSTQAFAGRLREVERSEIKIPLTPSQYKFGMFHFKKGGIIVGIGFIIAVIGLIQFAMGKPVISTFGLTSYLGCFLAMNAAVALGVALQLRVTNYELQFKKFNIGFWLTVFVLAVILFVTILTKSRTAVIALAVVLPLMIIKFKGWKVIPIKSGFKVVRWKNWSGLIRAYSPIRFTIGAGVAIFILTALFFGGKIAYKLKPMSASGRVLIWKVSAEMFRKNPISGVGFGNFANYYNLYQAEYFASGKGSVINKMTAGQIRHSYNWYLETAVEFGVFGLIVFGIFWWLILKEIYKTFVPRKTRKARKKLQTEYRTPDTEYFLNMGLAGAVLCFMIMSLFQFPWQIIPTYLFFNVALAWIVNANEKFATKSPRLEEEINKKVS